MIADASGVLGWSSDTEFEQAHIDWLSSADLIVHECGLQFKHTRWEDLDTLPEPLKGKIRLIHIPDGEVVPDGPMRPLTEGEILTVSG